jgi:hypothetical protein
VPSRPHRSLRDSGIRMIERGPGAEPPGRRSLHGVVSGGSAGY